MRRGPAGDLRAGRRGDHVVDGDPREVGGVEEEGDEPRAAQAERRARGDHRGYAQARPEFREGADQQRADEASDQDQREGRPQAEGRHQARARLQGGGDDVRAGEDEKEVERGLRAPVGRNGTDVYRVHAKGFARTLDARRTTQNAGAMRE
jgi:hypothetical protein